MSWVKKFVSKEENNSETRNDFLDSVNKVVKGYKKFSSTPKYMVYN